MNLANVMIQFKESMEKNKEYHKAQTLDLNSTVIIKEEQSGPKSMLKHFTNMFDSRVTTRIYEGVTYNLIDDQYE